MNTYLKMFRLQRLIALYVLAAIFMGGCSKDFLEVVPPGQQEVEQFWQTEDDATDAVSAMYANMHGWNNVAFAPIAVESLGSDDTEKGSSANDATFLNNFDNFTASSTEGQLADFWAGQYQTINFANQVLDHVDTMQFDDALRNRYLAEAKFVRAYCYFRLVRAFGDVPLRLHLPVDASEYNIARTPKSEVWTAIEQDLTDAASGLPVSYDAANVGRATKGAALALHAKVAMYQQKWQEMYDFSNQVISLGVYSLFPNYEQLFRVSNENSSESVFELQCSLIQGNPDASNSQYSQVQGVRGSVGGGWGFNVPTQTLADAYEAGDPRRDATIIFRGEVTPEGDAIPADGDNPRYNQKSYVPFSLYVTGYNEGAQQNIRILRYAEVLLMKAEAANELGNTAEALSALNQVRSRARGGNNAVLPDVSTTNQGELRTKIWHERHVELALEFDRYFDVIRQGRGAEVFGTKGWQAGKNEVWPIPQNEIDLSAGVLTQNPGY